jgi:hypothetical protein
MLAACRLVRVADVARAATFTDATCVEGLAIRRKESVRCPGRPDGGLAGAGARVRRSGYGARGTRFDAPGPMTSSVMTFFELSSRFSSLLEHDLFPKTGLHFSRSCWSCRPALRRGRRSPPAAGRSRQAACGMRQPQRCPARQLPGFAGDGTRSPGAGHDPQDRSPDHARNRPVGGRRPAFRGAVRRALRVRGRRRQQICAQAPGGAGRHHRLQMGLAGARQRTRHADRRRFQGAAFQPPRAAARAGLAPALEEAAIRSASPASRPRPSPRSPQTWRQARWPGIPRPRARV